VKGYRFEDNHLLLILNVMLLAYRDRLAIHKMLLSGDLVLAVRVGQVVLEYPLVEVRILCEFELDEFGTLPLLVGSIG
jgi:hypothetical protein